MKNEHIKAWITKYALTDGITVVDAEVCHNINSGMIAYGRVQHAHGKDWHRTPEAALSRAEEMRKAKIASLRKSIENMERLTFKAPNCNVTGAEPAGGASGGRRS